MSERPERCPSCGDPSLEDAGPDDNDEDFCYCSTCGWTQPDQPGRLAEIKARLDAWIGWAEGRPYEGDPGAVFQNHAPGDMEWLIGQVDQLQVLVTYREQTIAKLKAELDSNNRAFQRLIPEAEEADTLRRELERLRRGQP